MSRGGGEMGTRVRRGGMEWGFLMGRSWGTSHSGYFCVVFIFVGDILGGGRGVSSIYICKKKIFFIDEFGVSLPRCLFFFFKNFYFILRIMVDLFEAQAGRRPMIREVLYVLLVYRPEGGNAPRRLHAPIRILQTYPISPVREIYVIPYY